MADKANFLDRALKSVGLVRVQPEEKKESRATRAITAYYGQGAPAWTPLDYRSLAKEGYQLNVYVYAAIRHLAKDAASVPWVVTKDVDGDVEELEKHPLIDLMDRPNPRQSWAAFIENLVTDLMISGNAYIERAGPTNGPPAELYCLRPDRMKVVPGNTAHPVAGYIYTVHGETFFPPESVLHIKLYNPLDDWYGMPPLQAAARSVDLNNAARRSNFILMDNNMRPSGALVAEGTLTDDQYNRLQTMIKKLYSGPENAGRPITLEAGLQWQEMAISPKDMDWGLVSKVSADEVCIAFGIPAELLGGGEKTFSNYKVAVRAYYNDTVIPLMNFIKSELNAWLGEFYKDKAEISYNRDEITALQEDLDGTWQRVMAAYNSDLLTKNEARLALQYDEVENGDKFSSEAAMDKMNAMGGGLGGLLGGMGGQEGQPGAEGEGPQPGGKPVSPIAALLGETGDNAPKKPQKPPVGQPAKPTLPPAKSIDRLFMNQARKLKAAGGNQEVYQYPLDGPMMDQFMKDKDEAAKYFRGVYVSDAVKRISPALQSIDYKTIDDQQKRTLVTIINECASRVFPNVNIYNENVGKYVEAMKNGGEADGDKLSPGYYDKANPDAIYAKIKGLFTQLEQAFQQGRDINNAALYPPAAYTVVLTRALYKKLGQGASEPVEKLPDGDEGPTPTQPPAQTPAPAPIPKKEDKHFQGYHDQTLHGSWAEGMSKGPETDSSNAGAAPKPYEEQAARYQPDRERDRFVTVATPFGAKKLELYPALVDARMRLKATGIAKEVHVMPTHSAVYLDHFTDTAIEIYKRCDMPVLDAVQGQPGVNSGAGWNTDFTEWGIELGQNGQDVVGFVKQVIDNAALINPDDPLLKNSKAARDTLEIIHKQREAYDKGDKSYYKFHSMFAFDGVMEGVARHEMGHVWHAYNRDLVKKEFGLGMSKGKGAGPLEMAAGMELAKKYAPTVRGADEWEECMAENFTLYTAGKTEQMHPKMIKFFKMHIK